MNKFLIYFSILSCISFMMPSMAYEFSLPIQSPSQESIRSSTTSANIIYSGGTSERVLSNMEDPVTIKKSISPSKKNGYISGEKATVFVEIKNNKKNPTTPSITSLNIYEIPDDDLGVVASSAKWVYSNSVLELNAIKMDLLRGDSDSMEHLKKYENCQNNTTDYLLFSLNNSSDLICNEKKEIIDSLSNYFNINWINGNDVIFHRNINEVFINNSNNDSVDILLDKPYKSTLKISDGRIYDLKTSVKNYTKYIYDGNTELGLFARDFEPKGSILFWYDVKPKRAGNFTAETIVKLYDSDYSDYQDISYPAQLNVMESVPKFEIHAKPNKLQVYKPATLNPFGVDKLDVEYDITYLGGASEPMCNNITISFDKSKTVSFYFANDKGVRYDSLGDRSTYSFLKYQTINLTKHIVFPNDGIYSLPGIWINGVHYGLEEEKIEINVDTILQRNGQTIGWVLAFLGIIIGSIYGEFICKKTNKFIKNFNKKQHQILLTSHYTAYKYPLPQAPLPQTNHNITRYQLLDKFISNSLFIINSLGLFRSVIILIVILLIILIILSIY